MAILKEHIFEGISNLLNTIESPPDPGQLEVFAD
jgi:hypothetical protein